MKSTDIKTLLESYQQVPPERCWDAVEKGLQLMNAAGASASGAAATETTAKTTSFVSKILASTSHTIIASTAVVATVTATVAAVVMLNQDPEIVEQTQIVQNTEMSAPIQNIDPTPTVLPEDTVEYTPTVKNETARPVAVVETESAPVVDTNNVIPANLILESVENQSIKSEIAKVEDPAPLAKEAPVAKPEVKEPAAAAPKPTPQPVAKVDPVIENVELPAEEPLKLSIPNVFTPNGDFFNDTFVIEGLEECETAQLVVRAQNGQMVFQSEHYQNNWDANGLPDGLYQYVFVYTYQGCENSVKGRVWVKRQ